MEEGSSIEAEEEEIHETTVITEHEDVPEYTAGATAPVEVGPNGYAVSHPFLHRADLALNLYTLA